MRSSWQEYYMRVARQVATRATCNRKHIGAVIVKDNVIISTGYNGSIRGLPHCDDAGHLMEHDHCVRTVHAESNAVAQAAMQGISTKDADIYVTASPCWNCFKLLVNAGIKRIYYNEFYRDEKIFEAASLLNIELTEVPVWEGDL